MTQNPQNPKKYASDGHGLRTSATRAILNKYTGAPLNEHVGIPINKAVARASGESIGIPVYIMTKSDIEKDLSKIEERFGMSPEEFYKAWKNDKFHGFQAMKFGCLYEFYRDEFE